MLKKEEKQAREECFRPQQAAAAGNIVRTRVSASRMTTPLQEKAFSEVHIVGKQTSELELFFLERIHIDK